MRSNKALYIGIALIIVSLSSWKKTKTVSHQLHLRVGPKTAFRVLSDVKSPKLHPSYVNVRAMKDRSIGDTQKRTYKIVEKLPIFFGGFYQTFEYKIYAVIARARRQIEYRFEIVLPVTRINATIIQAIKPSTGQSTYSVLTETIHVTCPWITISAIADSMSKSHRLWLERMQEKAVRQLDI